MCLLVKLFFRNIHEARIYYWALAVRGHEQKVLFYCPPPLCALSPSSKPPLVPKSSALCVMLSSCKNQQRNTRQYWVVINGGILASGQYRLYFKQCKAVFGRAGYQFNLKSVRFRTWKALNFLLLWGENASRKPFCICLFSAHAFSSDVMLQAESTHWEHNWVEP